MAKDEKKYPWIKSVLAKLRKKSGGEANGVYAGPEYFKKDSGDDAVTGEVYAGPEIMDGNDRETFSKVYAGPEHYGRKPSEMPGHLPSGEFDEASGEAENAPAPEEEIFKTVYAAPAYFDGGEPEDKGEDPVAEAPEGENTSEDAPAEATDGSTGEGANVAPEQKSEADFEKALKEAGAAPPMPDSRMFMAVYAGPEYFNGAQAPLMGMPVPAADPAAPENGEGSGNGAPGTDGSKDETPEGKEDE